jgi:hypothetical protein
MNEALSRTETAVGVQNRNVPFAAVKMLSGDAV